MGLCRQTQDGQTHRPTASRIIASICASCIIARGIHTAQTHEDRRWKIAFSPGSYDDLISVSFSSSDETYIRPFTFISPGSYDISCPLMCVNRREDGPLPEDTGWPNTPANAKQIRTRAWPAQRQRAATAAGPVQASPFRAVQPRAPRPSSRWSRPPRPCAGHLQP